MCGPPGNPFGSSFQVSSPHKIGGRPFSGGFVFVPKLVSTLRTYDRAQFRSDASAGVIVGIVALPLAIAFAIASGVSPDRGLWTAIVAGFLILIIMGLAKFGDAIAFIPHPLVTGFTSGIALIILSGEVKDFFGLRMGEVPAHFLAKWHAYAASATTVTPAAAGIATLALAIIILWQRLETRVPGPFVALIVTTLLAQLLDLPVETIGSRFGEIAASVPHPTFPHLTLEQITALVGPAFTIALLAAVESLLSAVVADGLIGGQHRSNMELVAQGVANVVSPLFGGIPATGAVARTATNVRNGAGQHRTLGLFMRTRVRLSTFRVARADHGPPTHRYIVL